MSQYLIHPQDISEEKFILRGSEVHHLVHVMRKKIGEEILLFDGVGHQFRGRIEKVEAKPPLVEGSILVGESELEAPMAVTLLQGLPKGAKFEFVIEKAVELGVDRIVPFLSEKNIIRLDAEQKEAKSRRWEKIAEASAKQCMRPEIPLIEKPIDLYSLGARVANGCSLLLSLEEGARPLKELLQKVVPLPTHIQIIVGPESGFSEEENEFLLRHAAHPVSLGKRILRTETAGLAALAMIQYHFDLL